MAAIRTEHRVMREIHRFQARGRKLVLDVSSSRFFSVDDLTDEVLGLLEAGSEAAVEDLKRRYGDRQVMEVLGELREAGIIDEEMSEESDSSPNGEIEISTLSLHIAHECNLRCRYCYGDGGAYGGEREFMDETTARGAVDFLLRESGGRRTCTILFFGGEPLLNFDLLRQTVTYARSQAENCGKRVYFDLVTNGMLLTDEVVDYLNRERIAVQVSLDGPREVHDRMRVLADGRGSYDRILPRVKRLIQTRGGRVGARATVTHYNSRFMDTVTHLLDLGFRGASIDLVSGDGDWRLTDDDLGVIESEYERAADYLLERMRERRYFGFSNLIEPFRDTIVPRRRMYNCGSGKFYLAVSPSGEIFPCHRFVGQRRFRMGHLSAGLDREMQRRFLDNHVDNRPSCRGCWARYFCGGGCNYQAVQATGDILDPDERRCRLKRRIIELSMMIHSKLRERDRKKLEEVTGFAGKPYRVGMSDRA